MPDASRPVSKPAPLVRAPRPGLRLLQAPVAQRDRRSVVLGYAEHKRLGGLLGDLEQATTSRRAASRSPSATNAGTRQDIASARISVLPSSTPRSLASVSIARISSSDLAPRDQYERMRTAGQAGAILKAPRHLDRAVLPDHPAFVVAPGSRARARGRLSSPTRSPQSLLSQRRRPPPRHLHRPLVVHPGPPAGVLVPDRRPGEQLARPPVPGRSPPRPGTPPARRSPCLHGGSRVRARDTPLHAPQGPRSPAPSAVPSRSAASPNASAAIWPPAPRGTLYSTARSAPPNGAAGGEVMREIRQRSPQRPSAASSASPTRRCSSARRAPDSPS